MQFYLCSGQLRVLRLLLRVKNSKQSLDEHDTLEKMDDPDTKIYGRDELLSQL